MALVAALWGCYDSFSSDVVMVLVVVLRWCISSGDVI